MMSHGSRSWTLGCRALRSMYNHSGFAFMRILICNTLASCIIANSPASELGSPTHV